jgi:hypothetical protein
LAGTARSDLAGTAFSGLAGAAFSAASAAALTTKTPASNSIIQRSMMGSESRGLQDASFRAGKG